MYEDIKVDWEIYFSINRNVKGIDLVYEILKKRRSCCESYYALEYHVFQ